ncbi:MAG: PEGA domain-containing protein, partial [Deltaproteobacteria bacterium]|nr:PEGA domain-containing protein [Deltaproteobacteria bacterium]
ETQIYDNPEEEALAKAKRTAMTASAGAPIAAAPPAGPGGDGPDLSSLVSTSKGWDAAPAATKPGPNAPTLLSAGAGPQPSPPAMLAAGSSKSPSPFASTALAPSTDELAVPGRRRRESSAIERLVAVSGQPTTGPMGGPMFEPVAEESAFGSAVVGPKKSNTAVYAAIGAAVLLIGGGGLIYALSGGKSGAGSASGGSAIASGSSGAASTGSAGGAGPGTAAPVPDGSGSATGSSATPGSAAVATGPALSEAELKATGFDLYVTPPSVAGWRLDNQPRTDRLPSQIRTLTPGKHTIAVDAPPGFMSVSQDVEVVAGKADKVVITLQPMDVTAVFSTTPPGAKVSLVANGQRIAVGATPTQYKIDPRLTYQVIIEKDGFVSISRPLTLSGNPEEKIDVTLEKAQVAVHGGNPVSHPDHGGNPPGGGGGTPPGGGGGTPPGGGGGTPPGGGGGTPPGGGGGTPPGGGGGAPEKGEGILSLGAKPPCDIYIDGKSTGLKTPQREIKLSSGHHKVTLMNNEFGIKESFTVEIKAGSPTKMVKDFSDRIPQ